MAEPTTALPGPNATSEERRAWIKASLVAPAAPTFGELVSAKYSDERGLGFAIFDKLGNGAELRAQDKAEIAARGWNRDLELEKAVANLSYDDQKFIFENGSQGPASLRKAQARLMLRQETDAITSKAGVWTNVAADMLVDLANPAQWALTGGLGMVSMGARGAVALNAASKAGSVNALTLGGRAAMLGPATWKGRVAEDVLMNVAQGGLWGSLQDTLGGQVRGVGDYAADIAGATAFTAGLHVAGAGLRAVTSKLRALAGDPSAPSLLRDLRDGGLEEPYAGERIPAGEARELSPEEVAAFLAREQIVTRTAVSDITDPPGQSGDDLFDEGYRKVLAGEEAPATPPAAPVEAPQSTGVEVTELGAEELAAVLPELKEAPPSPFEPKGRSIGGAADDPVAQVAWGEQGGSQWLRDRQTQAMRDGSLDSTGFFSGPLPRPAGKWGPAIDAPNPKDSTDHFNALYAAKPVGGVAVVPWKTTSAEGHGELAAYASILRSFVKKYLPEGRHVALTVAPVLGGKDTVRGIAWSSDKSAIIGVREGLGTTLGSRTLTHEFGHVLTYEYGKLLNDAEWDKLRDAYSRFALSNDNTERALLRFGPGYGGMATTQGAANMGAPRGGYTDHMGEFAAEQFVKFMQKDPVGRGMPERFAAALKKMVTVMLGVFKDAKQQKLLDAETAFEDFFQAILDGKFRGRTARSSEMSSNPAGAPATAEFSDMTDYAARKVVGQKRAEATDAQRKGLYDRAVAFMAANPIKTERLRTINQHLGGGLSAGLIMARSQNAGIQALAARLSETTTGAAGRGNTAAVRWKYTQEKITGGSLREYNSAWQAWASDNGVSLLKRYGMNAERSRFNDEVVSEMLRRRNDTSEVLPPTHPVRRAADALDAANQRAVDEAKAAKIVGLSNLPERSRGYFTQELDGRKIIEAGEPGKRLLVEKLTDHFMTVYPIQDRKLGEAIAEVYVRRTVERVYGNGEGPMIDSAGSVVRSLREEMENIADGITDPALRQALDDSMRGMGNTRARLDVPLEDPAVRQFYNTDLLGLNRKYVHRMAAEVATTRSGLLGLKGVKELRAAALTHGPLVTRDELRATDQVIAEIFGTPVNGAVTSVAATNARTLTAAVRLGGAVFAQAGDTMNVAAALGSQAALKFIPAIPRLIGDLVGMVKGQETRGILQGTDRWGGQIGLRDYLIEMPLDAPDDMLTSYTEQPGVFTQIVRHIGHASQSVNFFRGFVAIQHRHVAEETLKHVVGLHLDGKAPSPAILDMGFTPELVARLGPAIALRNGRVMGFDPALLSAKDAETFTTSLHRGVGQMIQSNFAGERNAWAHNDWIKVMTQFRTFSITAVEKQWARQRAVAAENGGALDGYAYVGGLLLAQMAVGTLLYTARVATSTVGMSEKERTKRMKAAFKPAAVAQGALNASTLSGYTGDVLTALSALKGWVPEGAQDAAGLKGQRSGSVLDAVPAAGYLGQVSKAVQDPSVYKLAKVLPGANAPLVIPFVNMLKD